MEGRLGRGGCGGPGGARIGGWVDAKGRDWGCHVPNRPSAQKLALGLDGLGLFGMVWDRFGQFGTDTFWDGLGQFGTVWDRLGRFGTDTFWDTLGQIGTVWYIYFLGGFGMV